MAMAQPMSGVWATLTSPGSGGGGLYWIVKSFGGDYWNEEITESRT